MPLLVCPHCHIEMTSITKNHVTIDLCTHCQGIWLDKGELEKIMHFAKLHNEDVELTHTAQGGGWKQWLDFLTKHEH